MKRRLLNLLTALSLAMCAAVLALWYSGDIYYVGHHPRWSFTAERATITVHRGYERRWDAEVR